MQTIDKILERPDFRVPQFGGDAVSEASALI
jgi:hypothetical protein